MPDALTESYCERCGTRYEFAAPAKMTPMRRTRGLLAGFKNYVMSQDSLSDSVNDAMRSQAEVLASKQLDAFHSSFSFCIDCRQYTCTNCWNDDAGRCQSCQPLPEPTATWVVPSSGDAQSSTPWPVTDLTEPPPLLARLAQPEPEPMVPIAEVEPIVEAMPEPEPVVVDAEPEAVVEPEPVVVDAEPEAVVEPEPEPTPIRPLRPIGETFVRRPRSAPAPRDAVAAAADSETLAARRAQLDILGLADPGEGPVGPGRRVLPYRSSGAANPVATLAGGAFWDASAREVAGAMSQVGVRSCAECELSLSATARFCRRCGHPQSQSA